MSKLLRSVLCDYSCLFSTLFVLPSMPMEEKYQSSVKVSAETELSSTPATAYTKTSVKYTVLNVERPVGVYIIQSRFVMQTASSLN